MNMQMPKVREYLNKENVEWRDESDEFTERTKFLYKGHTVSVVCGELTYGGRIGLLEMMIDRDSYSVRGFLNAENVIEKLNTLKEK